VRLGSGPTVPAADYSFPIIGRGLIVRKTMLDQRMRSTGRVGGISPRFGSVLLSFGLRISAQYYRNARSRPPKSGGKVAV